MCLAVAFCIAKDNVLALKTKPNDHILTESCYVNEVLLNIENNVLIASSIGKHNHMYFLNNQIPFIELLFCHPKV